LEQEIKGVKKEMTKFRCAKGCEFHTNTQLLMIKHSITEHNAKFTREFVMSVNSNNKKLKIQVLKLVTG